MKLNLKQIKEITLGAIRVEENNGYTNFFRFTKEQEELYKAINNDGYIKTSATAGIKLSFKTDSKTLFLNCLTGSTSTRKYFSFDVYVNGESIGYLDNFGDVTLPVDYTTTPLPLGEFSKTFNLGEGVKNVCVYFPWSVKVDLKELSVDDGAFVEAVRPKKKLLIYGDSITQGFDVLRPSVHYAAKLAEMLNAEGFNKAIGGEKFLTKLAELKDDFTPDYITVAYGTNDWRWHNRNTFISNCTGFYEALAKNYPTSKIFAITPIWRKDCDTEVQFGLFSDAEKDIIRIVENIHNVTVISGSDLVPNDEKYYADLRLHPNNEGFGFYYKNLSAKLKSKL